MPEAVTPAAQAPNSTPSPASPAPTPAPTGAKQAAAKPEAPPRPEPTAEEVFEIEVKGEKLKRTKADLIRAAQIEAFAQKSINDSRTAYKALEKQRAAMAAAVASAQQGNPSPLLKLLNVDPSKAAADPSVVLKALGADPDAYARSLLSQKLELSGMTPEQRRIAELEAKQREYENQLKSVSEQRRAERIARLAKQQQASLMKELSAASERAGLPADERSLRHIYEVMKEMSDADVPMAPDLIVEMAKERIEEGYRHLREQTLKGVKGKELVEKLGEDVMKELRAHLITDKSFVQEVRQMLAAKLRNGQKLDAPAAPPAPASTDETPSYITPTALDERIKQLGKRHSS